jgi:hypothetical protein
MGNTTFSGPVTSTNGFVGPITGAITATNVTASGTLSVTSTSTLTGAVTASSTVAVTGALTSATAKTDYQKFLGLQDVLTFGTGTWTTTRGAQSDYYSRHTAGDETSIIALDITETIRTTASKGFELVSFDVIYGIGTLAMDAHTVTLDKVNYANNTANTVTSVAITGTLATATQANPYVTNVTVDTAAFDNTADSKYVLEITANNAATTVYDFYGVVLKFSRNDL